MDIARLKAGLRRKTRQERLGLSPEERSRQNAEICARLLALPQVASARIVLGYSALPEEADPSAALRELLCRGARVALPAVSGERLTLHWVDSLEGLQPGPFGIPQPPDDAPLADPSEFDVVLVPGLAFDRRGYRLGFGGGYYDRLLPKLRAETLKVGLAFDVQLLDELPTDSWDVRLDRVVAP